MTSICSEVGEFHIGIRFSLVASFLLQKWHSNHGRTEAEAEEAADGDEDKQSFFFLSFCCVCLVPRRRRRPPQKGEEERIAFPIGKERGRFPY